jgi:hypothetical protein
MPQPAGGATAREDGAPARRQVPLRALRRGLLAIATGVACLPVAAQELTPRAYWPAPVGTKVAVFAYQLSLGDVIVDASLPIVGVDSTIHAAQASYQQTFDLLGRTTTLQFALPYSWGTTEGTVGGEFRSRELSAFADLNVRLGINLRGAPAMDPAAFRQLLAAPGTIVGASLQVRAPTGGYDTGRLLNVGANRWAVRPGVGVIWPLRPSWLLELESSLWLFGDNDEFLGRTLSQDPLLTGAVHLVKVTASGLWVSLDANLYYGGRTTVDGVVRGDLQRNSRLGATLFYPIGGHAVRGSYSFGAVTSSGGDFQTISIGYLRAWR